MPDQPQSSAGNGQTHGHAHGHQHDHAEQAFIPGTPYAGTIPSGQAWQGPVAILGARLIDGTGADPIDDAALLMEGERIVAVGKRAQITVPRDATVIEAQGRTLMPGIIDCHVHVMGQWGYDILRRLVTPPTLATLFAVPNVRATLEAGITTVRDAAGAPAGVKMAIDRGLFPGPRMLVSITALSQTGGHGDSFMPCCIDMRESRIPDVPSGVVDGPEPMRQRVREILRAGADWIKLCTSGGVLSPADSPDSAQFTVEEIAVAVYEARAQGKRCMAHAQSNRGIKNAIEAGIASIEHGIYLDDEAIDMMKQRGVYLVPTLVAPQDVITLAESRPGLMPAYAIDKAREVIGAHRESFRKAVQAGVKVAMGTDTGVGPHGGNARELGLMVEHGMTPMQSIVASTRSAAELLHLDKSLGTLAAGKLADLLVVEGDPLADINVVAQPAKLSLVVKGGAAVRGSLVGVKRPVSVSV